MRQWYCTVLHASLTLFMHSLQEFTRSEMNDTPDDKLRSKLSEEKKRRELVLEMRHAMALEVTKKSKEDRTGMLRKVLQRVTPSANNP